MKYYYTYGSDPSYPFTYGWTEIEAPRRTIADAAFKRLHPHPAGYNTLNCAFVYDEDKFATTRMAKNGNGGKRAHERIVVDEECFPDIIQYTTDCHNTPKNINKSCIRTCIVLSNEQFEQVVLDAMADDLKPGDSIRFDYDYEGYSVIIENESDPDCEANLENDVLYQKLAEYFAVASITSIHIDDCNSPIGVWICYTE